MVIKVGREPDPAKRIRQRQGLLIRKLRTYNQLSVQEFAQKCEVHESAVSHWETGRYTPRPAMQVKIAAALGVPWSTVFSLDGEAA